MASGWKAGFGIVVLVALISLAGCVTRANEQVSRMRVGIVNLERVLPELPEYRDTSEEYQKDRLELYKDMKPGMKPVDLAKYFNETKKQAIAQSVQKWDDKKRKFVEKTYDKVRTASEQVAKDKKIDIVLVNAPWLPVSQKLAVDITTDVIYNLRESGKTVH